MTGLPPIPPRCIPRHPTCLLKVKKYGINPMDDPQGLSKQLIIQTKYNICLINVCPDFILKGLYCTPTTPHMPL